MRLRLFLLLSFVMTVMGLSAQSLVFHYCGGGEATVALPATWSLSDGKIVVSNGSSTIEINKNEILTVSYRGKQGDVNGDERVDIGDVATILGLIANSSEGGNNTSDGTPIGSGTAADPWNVAGVLAASNDLASMALLNDGADVYVKGVVTELVEISPEYGNATYYISDDTDAINKLYVYRGKLLDGAPVTSVTDLKVGDEVTVCGKVKNYRGTIEFDQGNYLVALKKVEGGGSSEPPVSPGTVDKPLTVAEALAYIAGLDADK